MNIDSGAHQNVIRNHGGVWGEVESPLHPVCPSILFSWCAWNRVCFVLFIYFHFRVVRTVVGYVIIVHKVGM